MKTLKFNWVPNSATDNANDYYPRAVDIEYVDMDQLIKDIAEPGSIVKETELRTVIRRFFQQMATYAEDALGFRCEFCTIYPVLTGDASDPKEPWDPERHGVYMSIKPGAILKEATSKIQLELVSQSKEAPVIETVEDFKSETINDKLSPGDMIRVTGSQLKIFDQPTGQSVSLIQKSNGQEYPVSLVDNFPSQLLARVPEDLPADAYTLKIVNTKYAKSITMRTALFGNDLTVE